MLMAYAIIVHLMKSQLMEPATVKVDTPEMQLHKGVKSNVKLIKSLSMESAHLAL